MPRTRPAYPPEFRREAVELVRSSGRSIPQVADELGVSPQSLRNWVKQGQLDRGERREHDAQRDVGEDVEDAERAVLGEPLRELKQHPALPMRARPPRAPSA